MKRLKDDQLNVLVNYFLEKRNYFNTHGNKPKRRCLSLKEMVTSNIVDNCDKIFPISGQMPFDDCDGNFSTQPINSACDNTNMVNMMNHSRVSHSQATGQRTEATDTDPARRSTNGRRGNAMGSQTLENGSVGRSEENGLNPSPSSLNSNGGDDLDDLDKCFEQLKRLPPSIPGSCLGYLERGSPCSVDIRTDIKYFAAGLANSEINLWSLTELGFQNQKSHSNSLSSVLNPLRLAANSELIFSHHTTNNNQSQSHSHQRHQHPQSHLHHHHHSQHSNLIGDKTLSGASILRGHSGPVYGLNFIQNSHHLISCSEDTTIRLWDLNNCKNTFVYGGHLYPIWSIDASPLELYFVSGSRDTTARLWSFERLYPLRIFTGHLLDVDVVKFHPNAAYIGTGSSDKTIRFWELKSGQMVRILEGHKSRVNCLTFSSDGKYLVSGGDDFTIKIWDLRSSRGPVSNISSHQMSVNDVSFNGDGSVLISASSDRSVKFWDFNQIKANSPTSKCLLNSRSTGLSIMKLKMLKHNVIYLHGNKRQ